MSSTRQKYVLLLLALTLSLKAQVQIDSITWGALDQHETAIAVSPINPKYVIATWNDFTTSACFSHFLALH